MGLRITLGELFHQSARRFAERPFITMAPSGETIAYGELESRINRLAHGMIGRFVESSNYVGIMLENSFAYVEMSYALKKINRVEVSINRAFRGAALQRMINLTACDLLLTSKSHFDALEEVREGLTHLRTLILVDGMDEATRRFPNLQCIDFRDLFAQRDDHIISPAKDTDVAAILFTSGTTGVSKGCLLPHRYAVRTAENMIKPMRIRKDDVNYTPYPLSHLGPAFYDILPM